MSRFRIPLCMLLVSLVFTFTGCSPLTGVSGVSYTLTMEEPIGNGTVTPEPGDGSYSVVTTKTLTAEPAAGWHFSHWEGDVLDQKAANTTIYINQDRTVRAVFVLGTTAVLYPALDRVICSSCEPADDKGWIQHWDDSALGKSNGYLFFDVREQMPEGLAEDVVVHSAQLRWFIHTTEIANGSVGAFQVLEPWDETTTWDQRPGISTDPVDKLEFDEFFGEDEWLEWDVTQVVDQWRNNEAEDYGFRVGHVYSDDFFGIEFWLSGSADVSKHPQLVVCYSEVP